MVVVDEGSMLCWLSATVAIGASIALGENGSDDETGTTEESVGTKGCMQAACNAV